MTRWLRAPVVVWVGLAAAGCGPGGVTEPEGAVRGVVLVEGASLSGVVVELTGPRMRTTTTDAAGRYEFTEVSAGAYVVSVRSIPDDASFPATSRTAVVSGTQTVTVDFLGNYIRTASIQGTVTSASQGLIGVTVTLEGAESQTTLTGGGGAFTFSGLRAGEYRVEISGLPESVTFPSVRTDVTLSTGQTFQVTFEGIRELTASVVIRSIMRRLTDGSLVPVDPQNVSGPVEVTVSLDRAEDSPTSVELRLDGEVIGEQSFVSGVAPANEPVPAPLRQVPLDIIFSVDTAEYDAATGDVRFPNGQGLLSAHLATIEGGASAWVSSIQVRLRNENTFTGEVRAGRGPVAGQDGEGWIGGDLQVSVIPVLYDSSHQVETVTVDLRRTGGSQQRSKSVVGGPLSLTWEGAGMPSGENLVGYQTPSGQTDQVRVISAEYVDGESVPGVPALLAEHLRIDNLGPPPPTFALPRQSSSQSCCLGNWVGGGFVFGEAISLQVDGGVGGGTARAHVGGSSLSDLELMELAPVSSGADLDPTAANNSLRAVAVGEDALGNETVATLAPSEGNELSNSFGAVLGVDLSAPGLTFDLASVREGATNPSSGSAWVLAATDDVSGVAPQAVRTTVRVSNPSVVGTPAQCLFPGAGDCPPTQDGLIRTVPEGMEGYLTLESFVYDRAGNPSDPVSRSVIRDASAPGIVSMQVPGVLSPGTETTFSAVATDNLDLHQGWIALDFGAPMGPPETVPPQVPQVLGVPFDMDLTTSASLVQTFPLIVGVERVEVSNGVNSPTGLVLGLSGARAVVSDVAGNLTARSEPVAGAGLPTRSFSVAERGDLEGVSDWGLTSDTDRVCGIDRTEDCIPGIASSVVLSATARGLGGGLERPFDRVHFYSLRSGEPQWIGTDVAPEMTDGPGPLGREWTWTLNWTPASTESFGLSVLVAVGVDEGGNALRTLDLTSVTVEGGP